MVLKNVNDVQRYVIPWKVKHIVKEVKIKLYADSIPVCISHDDAGI